MSFIIVVWRGGVDNVAHRHATFLCSWDFEIYIDDSPAGQLFCKQCLPFRTRMLGSQPSSSSPPLPSRQWWERGRPGVQLGQSKGERGGEHECKRER